MFWRVSGLQACPVDAILDKEEYTLEELLDEDELVQEAKSLNPRLIEFLKRKENVEALVRYMVVGVRGEVVASEDAGKVGDGGGRAGGAGDGDGEGDGGQPSSASGKRDDREGRQGRQGRQDREDREERDDVLGRSSLDSLDSQDIEQTTRAFKYPYTACEIFCCEVEGIYNTLLENEDVLALFFSILDMKTRPLNAILAGYFSRVMGALLSRRSSDIVLYLQSNPEILNKLVYHVDTTSVAEVLARLAGADDPVGYCESPSVTWLATTDILQLLVKSLRNDTPSEGQANAAEVLAAIARSTATQLTKSMANEVFMQELVDAALSEHSGTAASHALNVCLALLEPLTVDPTMGRFPVTDIHDVLRQEAVRCLSQDKTLKRLVDLLEVTATENATETETVTETTNSTTVAMSCLPTTYGQVKPPVGQLRLKIVDLLASLFRTTEPMAELAIMKTTAVARTMQMFLEYPFNNALHGGVTMLLTAFEEGSEELRRYLMEEAKLVEWLVNAPRTLNNASAEEKTLVSLRKDNTEMRAGYCGHLTQIANRLHRCTETCDYMKTFLENNEMWNEYKGTELDARNRVESVLAWKCGRPASQGVGLHSLYSSSLGYADLRHDGDDDIGDGFDSDHNRFAAVEVISPSNVDDGDSVGLDAGVTAIEEEAISAMGGIALNGLVTDANGVTNASNALKMSHVSSGELSMDDMEDDEVCFDMDDGDDVDEVDANQERDAGTSPDTGTNTGTDTDTDADADADTGDQAERQKEADATDGLLVLGESLTKLAVSGADAA